LAAKRTTFPATVHLLFLREGQILLLRRCNTGYADGQYSLPAGHLEGGETVLYAGVREAREELGLEIDPQAIRFSSVMHRREGDERVDFFLEVRGWPGEPVNAEPDKCDALHWVEVAALPANTVPYVRRAIQNHLQNVRFDEFGWPD
jgi:ADP-ribose pyrophosphatase YjhB (NUDIX family)